MTALLLAAIVFAIIGWWPVAIIFVVLAFIWPLIAAPFRLIGRALFRTRKG